MSPATQHPPAHSDFCSRRYSALQRECSNWAYQDQRSIDKQLHDTAELKLRGGAILLSVTAQRVVHDSECLGRYVCICHAQRVTGSPRKLRPSHHVWGHRTSKRVGWITFCDDGKDGEDNFDSRTVLPF